MKLFLPSRRLPVIICKMQLLFELWCVDLHASTSICVPTAIKLWISARNLTALGIIFCLQPMVQLHVVICNISPMSLILKVMFKFCRYWVKQNSHQIMLFLNIDMAVSRTQKTVLNIAPRYVFTVTFTQAMNSKLLLYYLNYFF